MKRVTLSACFAVVALLPLPAAYAQAARVEKPATVSQSMVQFNFPPPYVNVDPPNPPLLGYYVWRASFEDVGLHLLLRSAEPVATKDPGAVVRTAIIRRCPVESARIEDCTQPVAGNARLTRDGIELRITEPEVIELLLRTRPIDYWRIVHLPGGRFAVERVAIAY